MGDSGSANWLKRIVLGVGLLLLLVVSVGLGVNHYFRKLGIEQLKTAVAQADELDPGWRWEDLERNRAPVSDADNAALRVEAAYKLLPKGWLQDDSTTEEPGKTLLEVIAELQASMPLNEAQATSLQAKLKRVQPALGEARRLAGLRTGRFPTTAPENALSSPVGLLVQSPREIANLLWLDAALLAQSQQSDAALVSGRAILNAGRSIGDEPLMIAHLVRMACQRMAITGVERVLAQGQASEPALAATQDLFTDEAAQPILLYALRGERAYGDVLIGWMEAGDPRGFGSVNATGGSIFYPLLGGSMMTQNRALKLELMTEAVEIAKRPPDEQPDRFQELNRKVKSLPQNSGTMLASLAIPAVSKVADACQRSRADLRCAVTALAVERYRLAHGAWPETLDQLVPRFLAQVPIDPYDRKPLRFLRLDDGVLIYSLGPDGKDDGGNIDRKKYGTPGTDLGFHLWNVDRRRQPPLP